MQSAKRSAFESETIRHIVLITEFRSFALLIFILRGAAYPIGRVASPTLSHLAGPIGPLTQVIQHLPRFWHQQHPFILAIRKGAGLDGRRVPIAEVDLGTNLLWNSGRQGNLDP